MKFNVRTTNTLTNHAGATAHRLDERLELYSAVVTTSLSDKFYEKAGERMERIRMLIELNEPDFVARLAVYARQRMHLRSVPLMLAVELAKLQSGNNLIGKTVNQVVQRADEITELLAYYQLANARTGAKKLNKLSKQIQRGLSAAFNTFDEYQFAKYDRAGEIKLKDALFLVHPKAASEQQQAVFNKIVHGTLEIPYTWETALSGLGQKKFHSEGQKILAFRAQWEELILSGKLGYMATLRNLRNMLEYGVSSQAMERACAYLSDREAVATSRQLPFRFLAAYREVKELKSGLAPMVLGALEDAVAHSAANIRGFGRDTSVCIACDVSGSMQKPVSAKSKVLLYDIGLMLGMLLQSRCAQVQTGMFGDTWKIVSVSRKNILGNVQEFYRREGEVGYSTNGYKVVQDLLARRQIVDKIMLFTDCQLWTSDSTRATATLSAQWALYKKLAPKAKLYLFDLAGHGQAPVDVRGNDVYLIAGWSDKVFDVLNALDEGRQALSEIENITL
ncbi:TROVE domain-containing protein [Dawidia soli]|uniref:TROVE domain-containing protein n=1 Tax=Dawidia soli TaxID=2782352 RepID=A0AAP2DDW5_9BACT|nr:TROVE domain-containing protein [Dawidia soli]MBT1688965.1 TROVE domain-containing protein [Dawidia soli]